MKDPRTESMEEGFEATRPKLALYHPNAKGTGSAIILELYPATMNEDGHILCVFANQLTVGNPTGANLTYSTFDWDNSLWVWLDFKDLCHILQVFRGECESINDGRGLFKYCGDVINIVHLEHRVDPIPCYQLSITQRNKNGDDDRRYFVITPAESLGICEAVSGSMYLIAFGSPYATA